MQKIKLSILILYSLWVLAFILSAGGSPSLFVFSYITLFQFFIPGFVLGLCFGFSKRPFTEIIFYSFILSYLIYLVAALPTLFLQIEWQLFVGLNIFLYVLVFVIFIIKCYKGLILKWIKPDGNEVFVIILGILIIFLFTYINFRSDASQYNKLTSSSRQSQYVETRYASNWILNDEGRLSKEFQKEFHHDYKPYFSFLSLPLKYSSVEQRYGWFIFTKLFIFLSMIGIYCLGRSLLGSICGHISLLLFMFTVFVSGFYYGGGDITSSGILFAQAAYARHVAEGIFLIAFYLVSIEAFKNRQQKSFMFAGLILLCIFSIHSFAFYWAAANFFLFSSIVFLTSVFHTKNYFSEFKNFLKNNTYVALFSVIFLLSLIMLTAYWSEATAFLTTFEEHYPGFHDGIKKVNLLEQAQVILDKGNILFILSIMLGAPWLAIRAIKKKDTVSQFLFSNILLYLILKYPLVYNALMENNMRTVAMRLDGGLLFFIIVAFMLSYLIKRFKLNRIFLTHAIGLSTVIIFIIFGVDNSFANELRYRKNAGYNYLKMTEYFKSLKEPSNDKGGFTVLTNTDTAVDVYAFYNAYTFQYRKEFYWPLAISLGRQDFERLLFYPEEEDGKLIGFIENKRVDYIIIPTEKTGYVSTENGANFDQAINFYNNLKAYRLVYLDEYYYVYKKRNL